MLVFCRKQSIDLGCHKIGKMLMWGEGKVGGFFKGVHIIYSSSISPTIVEQLCNGEIGVWFDTPFIGWGW